MGSSHGSQAQQTQAQSQSAPWAPTQPQLESIISSLAGINPSVTPTQTNAINQIQSNSTSLPNFGPQLSQLTGGLLSNIPNLNGQVGQAYSSLTNTLSPYTDPNFLNPTSNPTLQSALQYIQQQTTDNVNSQFAGAGRDLSPANSKALGYGVASAEAPLLVNQFNQNAQLQQGAANSLFQAANTANNTYLNNAGWGTSNASNIPALSNMGPLASLAASNLGYSLPLSQLGGIEGLTLPIAGLGGQTNSSGTSNTQSSYTQSPLQDITQIAGLFGGQFSPASGMTNAAQGILKGLPTLFTPAS